MHDLYCMKVICLRRGIIAVHTSQAGSLLNALMDLIRSRISAAKNIFASSSLQSNPSWEVFCTVTLHRLSLYIVPHPPPPHPSGVFQLTSSSLPRDRKYPWEVDAWGEALLSQCAHHPGGEQEGPEEWWAHTERAGQDEAGTETSGGQWNGDWGIQAQAGTSSLLRL